MKTQRFGFRLEPRADLPRYINITVPILSFLAALAAGAVLLLATGENPIATYWRIAERAFLDVGAINGTLIAATPLLFTGLCAAVAFRIGFFNIGGEGQFYIGAITGSGTALALGADTKGWVAIPAMILAGAVGGALWAAIPGVLRAFFRTNEIITSLMLNYVAGIIAVYLIFESESFWRDLEGSGQMFPKSKTIPLGAFWPNWSFGGLIVPFGLVLGVAVAIWIRVLQKRTRFGYEMRVVQGAPTTARYAGMRPGRVIVAVAAISGALAGLGGAAAVGNFRQVLDPKGLQQSGYGYSGIVVAALARLNPIAVIFVAILIGGITNAGYSLQGADFPPGLVGILQGLILFCTLGGEVLVRYRLVRTTTPPPPVPNVEVAS